MKSVNYKNDPNKLRIRNFDASFTSHEICQLLIMILSKRKHKDSNVYSEYLINDELIDVVVEMPNADLVIYEVQKEISPLWLKHIKKRDAEISQFLNKPFDTIVIPLKEMPTDLIELESKLKEYII